jgi:prevent-host-death family protein
VDGQSILEVVMRVPVSEFKARCTRFFREVEEGRATIEITRRGKLIAVVKPPESVRPDPGRFLDCLRGTVKYAPGWDAPLGEDDWDACR